MEYWPTIDPKSPWLFVQPIKYGYIDIYIYIRTLHYIHHITSHHITSPHITSHHITSHHITYISIYAIVPSYSSDTDQLRQRTGAPPCNHS